MRTNIELADLFTISLENEAAGLQPVFPLIGLCDYGKTNQWGRIEYTGALRNKDVEICPIGHLAAWFFCRWESHFRS